MAPQSYAWCLPASERMLVRSLEDHVVLAPCLHLVSGILTLLVQDHRMVKLPNLLLQQLEAHNLYHKAGEATGLECGSR